MFLDVGVDFQFQILLEHLSLLLKLLPRTLESWFFL